MLPILLLLAIAPSATLRVFTDKKIPQKISKKNFQKNNQFFWANGLTHLNYGLPETIWGGVYARWFWAEIENGQTVLKGLVKLLYRFLIDF
jgi:hypothetical protein